MDRGGSRRVFALLLALAFSVSAQDGGGRATGAPQVPSPPSADAMLQALMTHHQLHTLAERCGWWSSRTQRLTHGAYLAITSAELRAGLPAEVHPRIDAAIEQALRQVAGFPCRGANGADPPQKTEAVKRLTAIDRQMIGQIQGMLLEGAWSAYADIAPRERLAFERIAVDPKTGGGPPDPALVERAKAYSARAEPLICRRIGKQPDACAGLTPQLQASEAIVLAVYGNLREVLQGIDRLYAEERRALEQALGDLALWATPAEFCRPGDTLYDLNKALRRREPRPEGKGFDELVFVPAAGTERPDIEVSWALLYRRLDSAGSSPPLASREGETWMPVAFGWEKEWSRENVVAIIAERTPVAAPTGLSAADREALAAITAATDAVGAVSFSSFVAEAQLGTLMGSRRPIRLRRCDEAFDP